MSDCLGDRMKVYESNHSYTLTKRVPVIIRIDGRAFHSVTRHLKGYSYELTSIMIDVAKTLVADMQGCVFAYGQSDEISFLLTDYKTINTQGWFGYDLRKLISISASLAASTFYKRAIKIGLILEEQEISFDSRAFTVPQDDVCNYFIWRQQDATRNAIQMAGREHFSHKQLEHVSCNEIQEMLFQEKQINFNDYSVLRKRGWSIIGNTVDISIPIFSQKRDYVENFVYVRED